MPLKCRGCKHYCRTSYKPEYHGYVEGCSNNNNKAFPHCFIPKQEEKTDGSMGCVQ